MLLPGLLATEAGGTKEFDVDAATVGDALRSLPVRDLLLEESGEVRPLVTVFVDGRAERDLEAAVVRPPGSGSLPPSRAAEPS